MNTKYSNDDGSKTSPNGPVVHVDPDTHALKVTHQELQFAGAPDNATVATAADDVFELEPGEKGFILNLGTNPLFVRRATGASDSAFHYILAAGSAADDGTGGAIEIDDHVGVVSVAGTSPRFIAWKLSA